MAALIPSATSRRSTLALLIASAIGSPSPATPSSTGGAPSVPTLSAKTSQLHIAYEHYGNRNAPVLLLLHGWPYDPRSFDPVVPLFVQAGYRVIIPFCRGCGRTRFISDGIPRSGEQAALGMDVVELLDALGIEQAVLIGYDWGARAASIVAALRPERVRTLISCSGYGIHGAPDPTESFDVETIRKGWYYWYFNTPMADVGLPKVRAQIAEQLWRLWSPRTPFDRGRFLLTATSFDNPDWIAVTLNCYRTYFSAAACSPDYRHVEAFLRARPLIRIPTLVLPGGSDGLYDATDSSNQEHLFTGRYERYVIEQAGHCPPTDAPGIFASAVLNFLQSGG